jgi:hypothetical protein
MFMSSQKYVNFCHLLHKKASDLFFNSQTLKYIEWLKNCLQVLNAILRALHRISRIGFLFNKEILHA